MNINNLILHYAKANLELDGIYKLSIPPGSKVFEQTTLEGVCGFVFPLKGKAKFTICKNEYFLEVGTILHAGSKMELNKEVLGDENWEFFLLHYKVLNEDGKESLLNMHYDIRLFADRNREIQILLEKLMIFQKEHGFKQMIATKAVLYEIIVKLFDVSMERAEHQEKDPINDIITYIHENLSKSLTIAEIAEKFGMNGKNLYYLFQKRIGLSPKKYIIDVQMKRAKELIIENNLSIIEVSSMIGYEDSLHFSRIFKQNIGMSPTEFRNQFRKNP